ncbi:glucose dehydrogenase [FAD, quinone]-like [Pectinophora gossypiella]|uniref:glucose dehydrogenase [FAD, quinone]-like n=1 Tax=Pectinophora gossypiella TaxID=13191 RepID=UPI00214EF96F|nr:glucose dehydrogenase [FAD, quinone]-like [Pectinophora gossypiella]XP_049879103.1 glucose dehydrogenase [FAD, quinone]-like [Pectinophora gossypiella]
MILAPQECGCPLTDPGGPSIVGSPVCSGFALFMVLVEAFLKGRCDIASPCQRVESVKEVEEEYDFIVVGAGPAGSIVASRLSEVRNFSVLLLEAGIEEPIGAKVPSFYRAFWGNEDLDWRYRTVPENYCLDQKGKGCNWPRGKVVGGCNVLNGLMYHRGHAADYEDWVKAGATGWSWEENKKYFDMTEGNKQIGTLVSEEYHSKDGPLPIQQFSYQPPFLYSLLDAINETGIPILRDMNDPSTPDGFMIAQTMNQDGQRYTTARAYLKPKSERPNLSLKTQAHVSKVLIDKNKRAYGVQYIDKDGKTQTVRAKKEVILSAGALNSPHILLLSGIGPKEELDKFKIPVVADLPVGKNLRNHYGITLSFIANKLDNTQVLDWSVFTEYMLTRTGPMSSTSITQLTGILYSSLADKTRKQPDIQIFFNGFYAECSKNGRIDEPLDAGDCYIHRNITANAAALLPRSVGFLTLNSTDPLNPPLFFPEYFTHPDDLTVIKDGARYLQKIFESPTMKDKFGVELDPEFLSPCNNTGEVWSDPWLECMARTYTDPQNHQLGTTAIGAVVDTQLRVYNVTGLRVIDAGSMPTQPTGNPQAAIMVVAERGAVLLKEEWA